MKIWSTKYALTQGIVELEAEISPSNANMVTWQSKGYANYIHKPHWHTSFEEAKERAESMRQREIEAVEKKLKKLRGMVF